MRTLFMIGLVVSLEPTSAVAGCPGACEVDRFLAAAPKLPPGKRLQQSKALFIKVVHPPRSCPDRSNEGRDEIWLWEYVLFRWAVLFRQYGSSDMLTAIDETPTDAGTSTSKCSHFYRRVQGARGFAEHYGTLSRSRFLRGCWKESEITEILKAPNGGPDAPEQRTAVTACEVDRFVDGLARVQKKKRSRLVEDFVAKVASSEPSDLAGTDYFYTRLAFRYRFFPDQSILDGIDAVAVKNMTAGICYFLKNAAGFGAFGEHYRLPDKKPLLLKCASDDHSGGNIEWCPFLTK
jgi:hypothetical protein